MFASGYVVLRVLCGIIVVFFFFKQKTAYEMRISDWSSDVCSSDLENKRRRGLGAQPHLGVLADVDDVVGENAVGATVHRHSDDVEATTVGERPQDRREYVACPAALRVEIEDRKSTRLNSSH